AAAEWFADGYVGLSSTIDADLNVSAGGTLRYKDVDFDKSLTYGGRAGLYLKSVPWLGFAIDGINYDANVGKQTAILKNTGARAQLAPMDISATAISLDVMLRAPLLASPERPGGLVTPYVLVGPGLYIATAKDRGNFIRRHQDDVDLAMGYNAGGGVMW